MFLLVCPHVGDKHMWQSKQSCHWWDCNAQGACTSMPMLAPRALNYLLTAASRMGHSQGQKPADNTKSSAQRTTSTCCHVVASETWHRAQAEDVLSHQESGTPRGTMTKLPIMLLQVDKSSLTGVCTHARKRAGGSLWHCTVHHIRASCCSQF